MADLRASAGSLALARVASTVQTQTVVVERGKRLTLKAHCSGSAPAYLAPDHESLLTFSGAELSGNVEPQEPCMTVTLRKNE